MPAKAFSWRAGRLSHSPFELTQSIFDPVGRRVSFQKRPKHFSFVVSSTCYVMERVPSRGSATLQTITTTMYP